jgi:hypothetical protein
MSSVLVTDRMMSGRVRPGGVVAVGVGVGVGVAVGVGVGVGVGVVPDGAEASGAMPSLVTVCMMFHPVSLVEVASI